MLGCDSIIYTLNLTELPAVVNKPVETKYICYGDTYTWYGQKCNVEKIYTHVVKNILGCDSIIYTLDLKVLPPTEYLPADKAMICWGDTYTWATDGKVYDKTGTYTHVIKNFLGCDSLVYTLDLTELPAVVNKPVEKQYICWGETYTWHGKTYDETTTDTYVVKNILGCDSIIYTLELTELPEMQTKNESISVCPSELPYTWRGQQLTKSGIYTSYVPFAANTTCDSLEYVLNLVVKEETKSEKTVTACDSYEWNGKVYTTSGRYTYSTTGANGCDSTAILYLTINRSTYSEEYVTVCYGETYEWNGMEYRQEGNYTVYLTNAAGCDSIAILHLTILPQMKHEYEELTLCPSDLPYLWHGQSLTKPGTYTDRERYTHYDCDRVEYHLTLKVYDFSAPAKVTMPRAICGNAVDVIAATEDIEAYIASRPSYAANATIAWQMKKNGTWATLTNEPVKGGVGEITLRYVIYSRQEGNYTVYLTNAAGCDSIAILHLTILPQMKHEYEELTLCPSDLPYLWHGQSLTKPGTYTDRERYTHYDCDRVEYHLTLKVYDFSAPAKVTMPRAICGNAVDVIAATEDIEAYIASRPSYAANATIAWQMKKNGTWATLTNEPVKGGVGEITLRYVIYSECGSLPSEEMVVPVEMPTPENDVDMDGISIQSRYNNRIFLFDLNAFNAKFGWKPEPAQVVWYKVVGTVDTYGEKGDDIKVGVGHSYNMPNGAVIEGAYYVLVERMEVTGDECEAAYRSVVISTVVGAQAPKLVPNAVRPSEMMTIKDLDPNQINEIYVYSITGEMLATYTAEKVREFMLRASNTTGYYIIDVVNNDGKHTLKYIVK